MISLSQSRTYFIFLEYLGDVSLLKVVKAMPYVSLRQGQYLYSLPDHGNRMCVSWQDK